MVPQTPSESSAVTAYSPLESKRFGLTVHRYAFDRLDRAAWTKVIDDRPDVAIVRIPAARVHAIDRLPGIDVVPVVADTLVYYAVDLRDRPPAEVLPDEGTYRYATPADREPLERLIRASFAGYSNHYAANPHFAESLVLDGFVEWGLGFLGSADATKVFVVERSGEIVAFAACRTTGDELEIVLNGVDPRVAGQNIYGNLVSHVLHTAAREVRVVTTSTQVHNYRVQRAWQKRGFTIDHALNTIHLNVFLGSHAMTEVSRCAFDEPARLAEWAVRELPKGTLEILGGSVPNAGVARRRRGFGRGQLVIEDRQGRVGCLRSWPEESHL